MFIAASGYPTVQSKLGYTYNHVQYTHLEMIAHEQLKVFADGAVGQHTQTHKHNCSPYCSLLSTPYCIIAKPSIRLYHTVQDNLLVRVIFGKFVCEKQMVELILAIELPCLSSRVSLSQALWLYGHVHIVINICNFNIGELSEKSPITNINSLPINRLVRYM